MIRSGTARAYLLRSVRLLLEAYAGAELPQWEALARTIRSVHLDPGDVLFSAGEVHPYAYYVEQGLLKAQMKDARDRTVIAFFSEEGEILGPLSALAPEGVRQVTQRNLHPRADDLRSAVEGVSTYSMVAIEPCLVHGFDYRLIDRLANQHIAWARLEGAVSMAYAITLQVDAARLRNSPELRYRHLLQAQPELVERCSRKDLAAYLNVTDVALSRIAKRVEASPQD